MKTKGHTLIELLVVMLISALILLVLERVYTLLWLSRIPSPTMSLQQVLSHPVYHAGHLGCRAVQDGVPIVTYTTPPEPLFLHTQQAIKTDATRLLIHDTFTHQQRLDTILFEGDDPSHLLTQSLSDWLIVADCEKAHVLPTHTSLTANFYPPITVTPLIINAWYTQNDSLYKKQLYPPKNAQPVLDNMESVTWARRGNLILANQTVFESENG